jgi:hypothetical protein
MNTAAQFNVSFNAAAPGDTIMITCITQAYPPATCELYRHGNKLNVVPGSGYIIPKFTLSDLGPYKCSCRNSLGSGHVIGTLTLYGTK